MSSWTVVTVNAVNGTEDELMKTFEDEMDSRTCDTGEIEGSNQLYLHAYGYGTHKDARAILDDNQELWEEAAVLFQNDVDGSGDVTAYQSTNDGVEVVATADGQEGKNGRDAADEVESALGFRPRVRSEISDISGVV